jgi:hypothetical protein
MANSNSPADERETRLADSDRERLAHLKRLTGRRINSRQDITALLVIAAAQYESLGPFLGG